jgi:hypothetical protein
MNHRLTRCALVAACALTTLVPPTVAVAAPRPGPAGSIATFEGTLIDLSQGWGEAAACAVTDDGTTCYRTEAEMDAALAVSDPMAVTVASASIEASGATTSVTCSSSLRLYDGTSFTTPVLSLSTRGILISPAANGFDNKTSSFKVGACSAKLYDGASGTNQYPGSTAANVQASSMQSGWNNVISSVLIP